MKRITLLFLISLIAACKEQPVVVAEIPVIDGCLDTAILEVERWEDQKLKGEYVEFYNANHMVPVKGYLRVWGDKSQMQDYAPYINAISSICEYSGYSIIKRDALGYRVLKEDIASAIESGKSELRIEVRDSNINVYR